MVGELRIKAYGLAAYPKWRDAEGEKAPRSGFGVAGYNYKLIDSRNQRQLVSLDTHEALQLLTQMQGLRRSLFDFQFHLQ